MDAYQEDISKVCQVWPPAEGSPTHAQWDPMVVRIEDVIAQRKDQVGRSDGNRDFDKPSYRRRNIVERVVGWLKESRRIATRFEKLAVCYMAMVTLGMILRLLGAF